MDISISPNIYTKTSVAADLPISVDDVAEWLRLSTGMKTLEQSTIEGLIKTTTEVFEKYTWLYLRRTEFIADYDLGSSYFGAFIDGCLRLSLERSPILALSDITKIEYLDTDGTYKEFDRGAATADGLYEHTTEKKERRGWASIYFRRSVPFGSQRLNAYKIRVTFTAGFTPEGTDPITDIPSALKTAMLMTIAAYYTNRGDCSFCDCEMNGFPVPCQAKTIADMFSIANTVLGGSYTPASGGCGCLGGY